MTNEEIIRKVQENTGCKIVVHRDANEYDNDRLLKHLAYWVVKAKEFNHRGHTAIEEKVNDESFNCLGYLMEQGAFK